jgi:tRNA dimethylallyltransferase
LPDNVKQLIAIVGPTGIGKSRLALHLAGIFHGEIVSADSRQIYRSMDIGTAKPSREELSKVPHHLIDIIDPDERFSLARYHDMAYRAIEDIYRRKKLPFLVGGSGLYVKSILEGWHVPPVSPDDNFRYNIEKKAEQGGTDELFKELVAIDPEAAARIDRRNVRRIIRALEVYAKSSKQFSRLLYKEAPDFDSFVIGLTADRAELYKIVDRRVDLMFERGLVDEVVNLRKMGYDFNLPAISGIGYRQVVQYLNGEMTLDEVRRKVKTETHRFIRHQYAWFRLNDERIHWFDITENSDREIEEAVSEYLGR